jgi:hypothetical protein
MPPKPKLSRDCAKEVQHAVAFSLMEEVYNSKGMANANKEKKMYHDYHGFADDGTNGVMKGPRAARKGTVRKNSLRASDPQSEQMQQKRQGRWQPCHQLRLLWFVHDETCHGANKSNGAAWRELPSRLRPISSEGSMTGIGGKISPSSAES